MFSGVEKFVGWLSTTILAVIGLFSASSALTCTVIVFVKSTMMRKIIMSKTI